MDDDQIHRIATMLDMVWRSNTNAHERAAALDKLSQILGGRSLADVVKEMMATARSVKAEQPASRVTSKPTAREKPWLEWKAEHEKLIEKCDRLTHRVAVLEGPRYEKMRPKPDENGNVPYATFLFALLACRDWQVRDCVAEFCKLTNVSIMEVTNWRTRNGAPYYYYQMLSELPFEGVDTRNPKPVWTDEALRLLDSHYPIDGLAMSDDDIAEVLSADTGQSFSGRAVHNKAWKLGYLSRIRGRQSRRLKPSKATKRRPNGSAFAGHISD